MTAVKIYMYRLVFDDLRPVLGLGEQLQPAVDICHRCSFRLHRVMA